MSFIRNTGDNFWGGPIRRILFGFLVLSPVFLSAQGEFNKWYFGVIAGIDFNSTPPSALPASAMNIIHASVSVADSLGNLLFYSQGLSVYNRNHLVMPNGSGLFGDQLLQGVFVVRKPGLDNFYYLFTIYSNIFPLSYGLYYSLIDMNLNGGQGDVVVGFKNIPVAGAEDAQCGIHGTRHVNNRDAWIVIRKINSNQYASYRITASGISVTPVLSSCSLPNCDVYTCENEVLKISQDGTRYVFVSHDPGQNNELAEIGLFNSQTGMLTPLFHFRPIYVYPVNPLFFEFSPDSKLLYTISSFTTDNWMVFQYDLAFSDSAQFMQSQILIASPHNGVSLQLGPDGKIYQCVGNIDSLNVINNPNVHGAGCNFQINALSLSNGTLNHYGLPQFLQRYKAYLLYSGTGCMVDSIHFSGDIWPPADTIRWNFGDPASGAANISSLPATSHFFSSPGVYTVELYVRHNDNRTDTSWRTITIFESPQPTIGSDRTICLGNTVTFDAGFCSGCTYEWKDVGSELIVGTTQNFTTGTAGTYRVNVTNGNGCTGKDTVQLITTPVPQVTNTELTKSICSGESVNISLTSNVPGTIFHWTASLTSGNITGFSADSGLVINQILTDNLPIPGSVTYHVIPKIGSCSGSQVDFLVTVNPGDSAKVSISVSANSVCSGTPVTFNASPTNPGTTMAYQWKVNGLNAGSNSPVFTYTPINDDQVQCILTSSISVCIWNNPASSNTITMTVLPLLPVSVSVSASANPVCEGVAVTFTADPVNGGSTPVFQWIVNGIPAGTSNSVFTYVPLNNDVVICMLTSSGTCTTGNPAVSNAVTMTGNPGLPASVTIAANPNPFCLGTPVAFIAAPGNGGSSPAYQWKVNGVNAGSNSPTFIYNPVNNDSVSCIMTSNLVCVLSNPAISNKIVMIGSLTPPVSLSLCFDSITTVGAKPFKLKGGLLLGGTWSGPGVNSLTGVFDPVAAGTGIKTIVYTYTNVYLCSAGNTKTITVLPTTPFVCGNTLTDIRDNMTYPTVLIGTQCWMAANLNRGIQITSSQVQYDNCIDEKYCYGNNPLKCTKYGGLYQWDEMMRYNDTPAGQGLCPPGWHVPTENDWTILSNFYNGYAVAGKPLQDTIISGFRALTGGVFYLNTSWSFADFAFLFWTSASWGDYRALSHGMNIYNYSVSLYPSSRANAFPLRCLRD